MVKKTKEPKAPKKEKPVKEKKVKTPKPPPDPVKTRDLIRLLSILALLLAIAAFLLQLFAVISHHWKWQSTSLRPLTSSNYQYAQPDIYNDSRLVQQYGLFSRNVRLYSNNDEHLNVWASTRFPRLDEDDAQLNQCLTQTSTLRGALLTCSKQVVSPAQCHCRRYPYWNAVIFFEIVALILLGLAVVLTALLATQYHGILRLAGAGVSLLAFVSLAVGLILILSYLKRETRSIADGYPHFHRHVADKLRVIPDQYHNRISQQYPNARRRAVRRQAHETYRAYQLAAGQHPYNETHFQEYSEKEVAWVYVPYSSLVQAVAYAPRSQQGQVVGESVYQDNTTAQAVYNQYGPLVSYENVYANTRAGLGWSTILSILAALLSLLLPLILIFSWLLNKKLGPDTKTVTTTTVKTEYVPLSQEIPHDTVTTRLLPTEFDPHRPVGDAIVAKQNPGNTTAPRQNVGSEPVIVRNVVIHDEPPATTVKNETIQQTETKN